MIRWERGLPRRVHWNNVPCPEVGAVFLLNGKCGNSSVKTALMRARGLEAGNPHRTLEVWSPARVARSGLSPVAVVRNPYARAVSVWHTKIVRGGASTLMRKAPFVPGMDFIDFLRVLERTDDKADTHIRAQWFTMYHRGRFLPERVVHLEDPAEWDALRAWIPALPPLPHCNRRDTPDWRPLVAGEAGAIIRRRYARDFELFGYPF